MGFEVVPCSIHRNPGARLEDIPCPMSPDDPDAPKPMEVVKGAHVSSVAERHSCAAHRASHQQLGLFSTLDDHLMMGVLMVLLQAPRSRTRTTCSGRRARLRGPHAGMHT